MDKKSLSHTTRKYLVVTKRLVNCVKCQRAEISDYSDSFLRIMHYKQSPKGDIAESACRSLPIRF